MKMNVKIILTLAAVGCTCLLASAEMTPQQIDDGYRAQQEFWARRADHYRLAYHTLLVLVGTFLAATVAVWLKRRRKRKLANNY